MGWVGMGWEIVGTKRKQTRPIPNATKTKTQPAHRGGLGWRRDVLVLTRVYLSCVSMDEVGEERRLSACSDTEEGGKNLM